MKMNVPEGTIKTIIVSTHPDPFHHEADVTDAHEVCGLIDGVDSLHVAGDLQRKILLLL